MKRPFAVFLGSVLAVSMVMTVLISCNRDDGSKASFIPDDYSSWTKLNREELNYPIPGHMNNYRTVYINKTGEDPDITERGDELSYSFPEGTIIVKEVYHGLEIEEEDKPFQLTVMIKDPNNSQARGGWLWVVKDLATNEETVFTHEFCVTCHANANEKHPYGDENPKEEFRDYVFFAPYVKTDNGTE